MRKSPWQTGRNCGTIKIYFGEQLGSTYDSNGNQIKYYEYDVNNRIQGMPRDGERFVRDDTGNIYYTNDHYRTFIQILD